MSFRGKLSNRGLRLTIFLTSCPTETKTNGIMNETIRTLETRRSVRGFDPERMPSDEVIKEIVEAGEYAPTGRNAVATHRCGDQQGSARPSV
ncbi:MAG: nitroreductase family protein [Prevotella pectinovora]